ncbi:UDP-glycosyltransferase UGT5-like [Macrosteles quadrilineatus]|uniref:UDP-glycosyltransferase UGT5-like n=1 Tax=Macrosteles quadrilineatus TaxID=74068 RepID=UPI0023E0C57A|nr:UDP-glycosyltransferase UGT5-like [Macrosteles quadrilineatus]
MANVGGPRSSRRRLLMSSVQFVLLYGAEVWADALNKEAYRMRLARVQRQAALRVASAYRTVSEPAVLVIAGVIPVKLLAVERKAIYRRRGEDEARTEERTRTYQLWQEGWEQETRGLWTRRLIQQVQPWVDRRYGEVDFYLTQFLTGHGFFRSYLFRMGKAVSPDFWQDLGCHEQPLFFLFLAICASDSARILGLLPMWARSHHRFLQPVMRALAEAGHDVTVYSPFPLDNPPPNYTDVHLANIKTESEELTNWFLFLAQQPHYKCFDAMLQIYETMYREFIGDPKIKQLLKSTERFDLIITEGFSGQEYTLLLAHKLKVPTIALQAFPTNHVINSQAGNSLSLSFSPGVCAPFSDKMTFTQKLLNSFATLRDLYYYYNRQIHGLEEMMRKDFPDMPSLEEMSKGVAMMFVNDHLTADYAIPRPPNIIPVGGLHIQPTQPLPQDIQKFADDAKDGLILFSLGTYVQDELQPQEYFDMYNNVFRRLKQRVIWKTRKENILGLPKNVMTLYWAPQQDILAHPNCVLFITHGGLHSQHEAIHFGVCVIGIPQFFDQHRNVKFFEEQGVGVKIETEDLSEKTISAAIRKVLDNPSYRDRMKKLSAVFRDRPMSPAKSVVFWTEYVLRHGGAPHLRPASTELRWYQLILLDVLSCVLTIVILVVLLLFVTVNFLYARLFSSNRQGPSVKKKLK